MAKLWFKNYYGEKRVIAYCNNPDEVRKVINAFILKHNQIRPKEMWLKVRFDEKWKEKWEETKLINVGEHGESFYTESTSNDAKEELK